MFNVFKRRREAREREARERRERLVARQLSPDFSIVQERFGRSISQPLRDLYSNVSEIQRNDVTKVVPNVSSDRWIFIAWYEPLDRETLDGQWGFDSEMLEFADDGLNNRYAVDPTDPDSEIVFFDHETDERKPTGVKMSQFAQLQEPHPAE